VDLAWPDLGVRMKKKFEVIGTCRGFTCEPEIVEIEVGELNDSELKEALRKEAALDSVTSIKEIQ
jgi:hypothetical protein